MSIKMIAKNVAKAIPSIKIEDINMFYDTKQLKKDNDKNNKIRESILLHIGNNKIPEEWFSNEKWSKLKESFINITKSLISDDYDHITVEQKAGRNFNYDFIINFIDKSDKLIVSRNVEFKYNCESITKCPQFLNRASKEFVKSYCYAEFFYDNYIKEICVLADIPEEEIIDKATYMKYIHNMKCDIDFFKKLRNKEKEIKKAKKEVVDRSIYEYLLYFANIEIDIEAINTYLSERQSDKHYILYKNGIFYKDYIKKEELTLLSVKEIKNNNTIVFNTESNSTIEMLLRWKNYAGVLYTGWQVKLVRK